MGKAQGGSPGCSESIRNWYRPSWTWMCVSLPLCQSPPQYQQPALLGLLEHLGSLSCLRRWRRKPWQLADGQTVTILFCCHGYNKESNHFFFFFSGLSVFTVITRQEIIRPLLPPSHPYFICVMLQLPVLILQVFKHLPWLLLVIWCCWVDGGVQRCQFGTWGLCAAKQNQHHRGLTVVLLCEQEFVN